MPRTAVPRVDPDALAARLDDGDPPVVLDVRGRSYLTSDRRIPGALRIHPRDLETELDRIPAGLPVVAYCT